MGGFGFVAAVVLMMQGPGLEPETETLAPGTIAVEPMAKETGPAVMRQAFADAVERALFDANFTALPATARSRYVARLTVTRTTRGAVTSQGREPGASVASTGNWGAGLAVTMPSGKNQLRGLIVTELTVEIVRRDGMVPVWRGRALTAQPEGTMRDTPAAVAAKLAPAVIRAFPAQQGEAVSVP